jgi:hypothetical protein
MSKLLLALPLPGAGSLTLARFLNTHQWVQAITYYDFVIDELAEDFGLSREFMVEHMSTPSNALTFMQHSPRYRADAKRLREDFFTPRSTAFHVARYLGDMRFSETRIRRMLGAVNDPPGGAKRNLVFFDVHTGQNDIPFFQTYAKESGRAFTLIDLTRSGMPGLAERRYKLAGGVHVDNREGAPHEAVKTLLQLIAN